MRKRTNSSNKKNSGKKSRPKIATVQKLYPNIPKPMTQPKVEIKTMDVPLFGLVFQSASTVMTPWPTANAGICLLNATKEGTGISQRVGRKINMKSIALKGAIYNEDQASIGPQFCRLILILDKQSNTSFPTIQTLLSDVDYNLVQHTEWNSGLNIANSDRFTVLMDTMYTFPQRGDGLNVVTGGQQSTMNRTQDYRINNYIKLKGAEARYNGSDNNPSINQIVSGSLFLVAISDTPVGQSGFAFQGKSRLRYWDA